jgi:hypothetical protein
VKKRYLVPILLVVLLMAYGIGYGVGASTKDAKSVELAGKNVELMWENTKLREALWEAQDKLRTSLSVMDDTNTSSLSYDDKCRLMEIENEIGKIQDELIQQKMEREGLAAPLP